MSNNSVSIVCKRFERDNRKNRIIKLLYIHVVVVVVSDNGLPQHVCMKCCRPVHVEGLEKAVKDLEKFRQLAFKSYVELPESARMKRNKESGAASVTSNTAKSRPPAKKLYTIRSRLGFGEGYQMSLACKVFCGGFIVSNSAVLYIPSHKELCLDTRGSWRKYSCL